MTTYDIYINSSIFMKEELFSFAFVVKRNNWTICKHAAPILNTCKTTTEAELMAVGHAINSFRLRADKTAKIIVHSQNHGVIRHINGTDTSYNSKRCIALMGIIRELVYSDLSAVYDGPQSKEIRWCDYHCKKVNLQIQQSHV